MDLDSDLGAFDILQARHPAFMRPRETRQPITLILIYAPECAS